MERANVFGTLNPHGFRRMPHLQRDACPSPAASAAAEERRHERHLCVEGGTVRLAVRPTFRGHRAILVDVSAGGIGVLLEGPLAEGTVLALHLGGVDRGRMARVRHCRPHPAPADAPWQPRPSATLQFFRRLVGLPAPPPAVQSWLAGCEFTQPLAEGELEELLALLGPTPEGGASAGA
jgi:PilZ domain-containing protein